MKFKTKIWQLSILVHITSRKLAPNHMSIDRSITKKLINEHVNMGEYFLNIPCPLGYSRYISQCVA